MDGRKKNKGTVGNKGGRKPKSEEQRLIERLTPMAGTAHEALNKALKDQQPWAIKLWFEYFYGKPQQSMDVTSGGDSLSPINITVDSSDTAKTLKKLRDGSKAD